MTINYEDWNELISLMDRADEFSSYLVGKTEDGELVLTSINNDFIVVETHQANGYIRKNYYHRDMWTEELYEHEETPDADVI